MAVAYVVGGWALAQGIAQVLPIFDVPNWVVRLIVVLIVLGFPMALTLSWFFDLTRYGIVRTPDRVSENEIEIVGSNVSSEKSIAVLPFNNLSAGKDDTYFSDGIAEELLGALAKVDGLRVAARRSSFSFKDREAELVEIASRLNVEHVLEGSVRRDGNRVRVTAGLIDARAGFTIWSETYEREMHGIFALQDEITRAIVDTLKLKLAISAPSLPRSTEAYDDYLRGLFYSDAYVKPLEAYSKVRDAAMNAINIDDGEAEAHVYLAETKRILDWDLRGAEAEYLRAFEIDSNSTPSNYFIAAFYAAVGERDKALGHLSRTAKIDPASLWVSNFACEIYRYFGLIDEAMAAGERSLQLDPTFVYSEPLLAALYREMGRFDDAIALYKKSQDISGRVPFGLAITYAKMNRREEAREILKAACATRGSYTPGDATAHVHVVLGENEQAIRELQRAYDEHSSSLHFIGIAPEFEPMRADKRFVSIVERIGLEPEKVFAANAQGTTASQASSAT